MISATVIDQEQFVAQTIPVKYLLEFGNQFSQALTLIENRNDYRDLDLLVKHNLPRSVNGEIVCWDQD